MNHWKAIALVFMALSLGLVTGELNTQTAHAERPVTCEWRYIHDDYSGPNIPVMDKERKLKGKMDEAWQGMSASGFHLAGVQSGGNYYVFERCR